jgi:hypothetical protein
MAFVHAQTQFREHRVLDLEVLGNVVGADIRQYFTYLPGLLGLLALPGTYIEEWVRGSLLQFGLLVTIAIFTTPW